MFGQKRILRELRELWVDPPPFCRPGAMVTDLLHWEVVIDGPEGTPYEGGAFRVDVRFPGGYPFKPVKMRFKTKIFHPNIAMDSGEIALDILQREEWRSSLTIENLLVSIVFVLCNPLLDFPINGDAADLCRNDPELYEEEARAWTRKYASAPVVSYYPGKENDPWHGYCVAVAAMCYADWEEKMLRRREKARERRRRWKLAEKAAKRHAAAAERERMAELRRASGVISLLWKRFLLVLGWWWPATLPSTAKAVANERRTK
ncbi:hypothetical protein ACP70R_026319 [Stipagrostis hirtigluma subsp. patula]